MNTRNAEFTLRTFKRFEDNAATAYSNAAPVSGGSTPDVEAITHVGRALAKRAEPRKVLLVLIDGGTQRADAIAAECRHLKRMGVAVVAVGLNYSPGGFPRVVRVYSMRDLAGTMMRTACDAVAREFEAQS